MARRGSIDRSQRGLGPAVPRTQVRPFYQVVVFVGGDEQELDLAAEIRSLGMQNLNAPGRTVPEGKTHFARDATYTLSPTRDALFGFRYAFAVERDGSGRRPKPFGCSTSKRKVTCRHVGNKNRTKHYRKTRYVQTLSARLARRMTAHDAPG